MNLPSAEPADDEAPAELDWAPMVRAMMADVVRKTKQETMARKFHNTLAEMIARVAGEDAAVPVSLSGGCFQNRLLTELTVARLRSGRRQGILAPEGSSERRRH